MSDILNKTIALALLRNAYGVAHALASHFPAALPTEPIGWGRWPQPDRRRRRL